MRVLHPRAKRWSARRIIQCFRDVVVREKLPREAASLPYLQRKHVKLRSTGFVMLDDTDAEEPRLRALRRPSVPRSRSAGSGLTPAVRE